MISLIVLSLKDTLYRGEVTKITAPGVHGQFTILPDHLPFLTTLKKGAIRYTIAEQEHFVEVPQEGGGFELVQGQATVLLSSSL